MYSLTDCFFCYCIWQKNPSVTIHANYLNLITRELALAIQSLTLRAAHKQCTFVALPPGGQKTLLDNVFWETFTDATFIKAQHRYVWLKQLNKFSGRDTERHKWYYEEIFTSVLQQQHTEEKFQKQRRKIQLMTPSALALGQKHRLKRNRRVSISS